MTFYKFPTIKYFYGRELLTLSQISNLWNHSLPETVYSTHSQKPYIFPLSETRERGML
jgi:hypothetical protein